MEQKINDSELRKLPDAIENALRYYFHSIECGVQIIGKEICTELYERLGGASEESFDLLSLFLAETFPATVSRMMDDLTSFKEKLMKFMEVLSRPIVITRKTQNMEGEEEEINHNAKVKILPVISREWKHSIMDNSKRFTQIRNIEVEESDTKVQKCSTSRVLNMQNNLLSNGTIFVKEPTQLINPSPIKAEPRREVAHTPDPQVVVTESDEDSAENESEDLKTSTPTSLFVVSTPEHRCVNFRYKSFTFRNISSPSAHSRDIYSVQDKQGHRDHRD